MTDHAVFFPLTTPRACKTFARADIERAVAWADKVRGKLNAAAEVADWKTVEEYTTELHYALVELKIARALMLSLIHEGNGG